MKIVVTGSHGFLGRHVLTYLEKRKTFRIVKIRHDNPTDKYKLKGASCIIHLAGVNRGSNKELKSGNLVYTKRLLRWCHVYAPKARIVFISSSQVYIKNWYYGKMKLQAENLIREYSEKYNVPCIVFRFSNIFGPFCKPFYNSIIATFVYQIVHSNELIIFGDGNQKRDFIYVSDAVKAIQKAILYSPKSNFQVFDICSGKHISVNELLTIFQALGPKSFLFHYETKIRQVDVPLKSSREAKQKLHWRPSVSMERGLKNIFLYEYGIDFNTVPANKRSDE